MPPSRRSHRTTSAIGVGVALALCAPSAARAEAEFQLSWDWPFTINEGFVATPPNLVQAPAGSYQAGQWGGLHWCLDYGLGVHFKSATVRIFRFHAASTARVEFGPSADGSGGISIPEGQIPRGEQGALFTLAPLNARCIGARARQTGDQSDLPSRLWGFELQKPVTLVDEIGPSVADLRLSAPQHASWYTGPLTVTWTHADNRYLRGTTGAHIRAGDHVDRGDPSDGEASAVLDPGPDGTQTVEVYRHGQGWQTAIQSVQITVDRTPPPAPTLTSTPSGTTAPVTVSVFPVVDNVSGVAGYQYSFDGGRALLATPPTYVLPGAYATIARVIDNAGNIGPWSAPLAVSVLPPPPPPPTLPLRPSPIPSPPSAPPAGDNTTPATPATPVTPALPDLSRVHLARIGARGFPNRVIDGRPGPSVLATYGQRVQLTGRYAHPRGRGLRGAFVLLRDSRGTRVTSGFTDRMGRFSLSFPARRPGLYRVSAIGTPEVSGSLRVRVRARVSVRPAGAVRRPSGRLLVVARPARTLVVRGRVGPGGLARGKRVELQYRDRSGNWQTAIQTRAGRGGAYAIRYRFGFPGRTIRGQMRVAVPADRGWPFAEGATPPFDLYVPA